MPLTQAQINDAVMKLLDGHDGSLQLLREGVASGEVIVQAGGTALRLRARPLESPLADALRELRTRAGDPPDTVIAEALGVSASTIFRTFDGSRCSWPTVRLIIEYLGGNAADYRRLWQETKGRG